jgi:hypothetical protein
MKKIIFLLILIASLSSSLFAEIFNSDNTLKSIENNIRKALSEIESELAFEYPKYTSSLVIKYKTRKFMVHTIYKTGRISDEAFETEGPSYKGFLIKIYIEKKGTTHQAIIPQRINEIYWETDLNHTVINNTDRQIHWRISFGVCTDKELLEKIKNIIIDFAK